MGERRVNPSHLWLLTGISLVIALFGLIAIYNASVIEAFHDFNDKFHFVKQQSTWLLIGLTIFIVLSRLPPSFYLSFSTPAFLLSLLFMLLVLIPGLGLKLQGARRWLSLGFISFQPSELLKISMILYLSSWLQNPQPLKKFITILAICLGLIMLQPDLGTGVVVAITGFGLYYLSGARLKEIFTFSLILVVSLIILIFSSPYRMERLHTFLDPTSDPQGRSYHINQVLLGLGSGNLFGVGLGRSRQKYAYLPEATTDSIFTIIGEETGFVGGSLVIISLLTLCLLSFKIALNQTKMSNRLLASGVGLLISSQTFINLASMVALVPLTGVPLPLISYGGSSLVVTFIALGILASTAKHS